jgi:predicted O-methyltransferase YrrM
VPASNSPIVDLDEARRFWRANRDLDPTQIGGVEIDLKAMLALWNRLAPHVATTSFPADRTPERRFWIAPDGFPIGDATILRAMIMLVRPQRIIEIGSGFSSACMLDAFDEAGLETKLTCIEPYPNRLRSLLKPDDPSRCTIIEGPVQSVEPELFDELQASDVVFIDSSHILKTGSDVVFELFEIIPRLKPGVIVHFHDIRYPFEYPEHFVFERHYSWNEIYAVRAFLMFNRAYRIIYFNSLFGRLHRDLLAAAYVPMVKNPGSSLWIERSVA